MSCPITGCMDDICIGSQQCMQTGYPLGQRCPVCDEVSLAELDIECACEREERYGDDEYELDGYEWED